jgi:EpsI family protein
MRQPARVVVTAACLVAGFVVLQSRSQGEAVPLRRSFAAFPSAIGDWRGAEAIQLDVETLAVLKPSDYLMRRYVDAQRRPIWLYIGYWETQRKGAQPHSPKNCLPGSGWEPLEASLRSIPVGAGRELTVNQFIVQKGVNREAVFYWYRSQGADLAGEVAAKVAMIKSAITRNRTDGALIRVSTPVYATTAEASQRLVAYVQAMYPSLSHYLPE